MALGLIWREDGVEGGGLATPVAKDELINFQSMVIQKTTR